MIKKLLDLIDSNEKTILVAPSKYHKKLIERLLTKQATLMNFQILSIENLFKNILNENLFTFDDELGIISKLKINNDLIMLNHKYANNINYINELFKLQNEFINSNISTPDTFEYPIKYDSLDLTNIKSNIKHLILLSDEDIQPVHQELITVLANNGCKVSNYFTLKQKSSKPFFINHDNTIKMLDYIIYEISKLDKYDNSLIICDSNVSKDYLKSQLTKIGVAYDDVSNDIHPNTYKLNSLFRLLDNDYDRFDVKSINSLLKKYETTFLVDDIIKACNLNYKQYIEFVYTIITTCKLFEYGEINNLFVAIYKLDTTSSKSLINQLLLKSLSNKLKQTKIGIKDAILIADCTYSSIDFENVFVVDSSLPSFVQTKASYLLDTDQRSAISNKLLSVVEYGRVYKLAQTRLLNCAQNIYFNSALIDLDNKSKEPAFFITQEFERQKREIEKQNIEYKPIKPLFKHIFTSEPYLDSNELLPLTKINIENILNVFNNKLKLSPSKLDTFYKCQYNYFVTYVLNPNQQKVFDNRNIGTIYHEVLEYINNYLITNDLPIHDTNIANLEDLIDKQIDYHLSNALSNNSIYNLEDYKFTKLSIVMKSTLVKVIKYFRFFNENSSYDLNHAELALTTSIASSVFNEISFSGKVDSVFKYKDYSFVLDYKSSKNIFDLKNFHHGIQTQLISYTYLLAKNNSKHITGAFYKTLKDEYAKTSNFDDTEMIVENHFKTSALNGLFVNDGDNALNISFDKAFNKSNKSIISDIEIINEFSKSNKKSTKNSINTLELLEQHKILEWHLSNMITTISSGLFEIKPYEHTSCDYCNYKAICHINKNMPSRKDEAEAAYLAFIEPDSKNGDNIHE
ncbi:PD-(D/E)XK nuclease family protein [Mycoplasma sp. P36-A1]|uniref:PD-(D/E)XK nuclease family protein n=1 Tax=Mycoplasma sp. P36-A1 TaxID=3252900 RepID=UPI003C2B3701